jgi:hypothetical protein
MIKFKDYFLKEELESTITFFNNRSDINEYNIGPVYHGGGWNGVNAPLVRDGALGTGIYFTNSKERALSYTQSDWKEIQGAKAGKSQHLIEARLRLKNPVVVENTRWPEYKALIQLGMKPERAENIINKAQERTGNTGSSIKKLGESKGYDGIIVHQDNNNIEYIVWQPYNCMVTNVEKL